MIRLTRSSVVWIVVLLIALAWGIRELAPRARVPDSATAAAQRGGTEAIVAAFRDRRSGVWVEAAGTVQRTLTDDTEGSRHQRFILRLSGSDGQTVLISHNIDLADRLPVRAGDRVAFRGMYEWNDRGGVVHWTHHDPENRHAGGWLRLEDVVYR